VKSKAFTLLELIVILAVVAVLIAAMGPALRHARDDAKTTLCMNNQSAILRGLGQYVANWHMYPMNYRNSGINSGTTPGEAAGFPPRFALEGLSTYVGGPATDLRNVRDFSKFPRAYVCPSADKAAVYPTVATPLGTEQNGPDNFNYWYHASYWVNPAVRSNRGFNRQDNLCGNRSTGQVPGMNAGITRFYTVCRNYLSPSRTYAWHWKSVYMPSPETVGDLRSTVFTGDTPNATVRLADGTMSSERPGFWRLIPGWGYMIDGMGFDRHNGMVVGYLDGHARRMVKQELNASQRYDSGDSACDFMLSPLSLPGCGGQHSGNITGYHTIPAAAFQYGKNAGSIQE
jgi:type II secretory pathway pseudopilin PulG